MAQSTNDNDTYRPVAPRTEPDAHGQAALLLVESLIHALVERSVIRVADAVEIVEVAAEVKTDLANDAGESRETLQRSLSLLAAINDSLRPDLEPTGSSTLEPR